MLILFDNKQSEIIQEQEVLLRRPNLPLRRSNGIIQRFQYPVVTKEHIPLFWRYDFDTGSNPFFMERISFNSTMNAGAL
jgi:4-O-beta-D-mannosyl-D-glucose phosphorylase